jgi:hypothetical protein
MNLRHYIHYIISFYIIFGGVITKNLNYVKIHFFVTFLIFIHWVTNDGQCFLSEMDYDKNVEPNGYMKHLLASVGIHVTPEQLNMVGWSSIILPCLYSFYILKQHDINIFYTLEDLKRRF